MSKQNGGSMTLSVKSFLSTVAILVRLMILAGVLTQVLPQGTYERVLSENGYEMIVDGSYRILENAERLPVWRWFAAPPEMMGDAQALTAIVIIVFILLVGGTFAILEKAGVFRCLIAVSIIIGTIFSCCIFQKEPGIQPGFFIPGCLQDFYSFFQQSIKGSHSFLPQQPHRILLSDMPSSQIRLLRI